MLEHLEFLFHFVEIFVFKVPSYLKNKNREEQTMIYGTQIYRVLSYRKTVIRGLQLWHHAGTFLKQPRRTSKEPEGFIEKKTADLET